MAAAAAAFIRTKETVGREIGTMVLSSFMVGGGDRIFFWIFEGVVLVLEIEIKVKK